MEAAASAVLMPASWRADRLTTSVGENLDSAWSAAEAPVAWNFGKKMKQIRMTYFLLVESIHFILLIQQSVAGYFGRQLTQCVLLSGVIRQSLNTLFYDIDPPR